MTSNSLTSHKDKTANYAPFNRCLFQHELARSAEGEDTTVSLTLIFPVSGA
jgi:hypothetical protein